MGSFLKVQHYIFKATLNLDFPKHIKNVKISSATPLKVSVRRVFAQMATQVALERALPFQSVSLLFRAVIEALSTVLLL